MENSTENGPDLPDTEGQQEQTGFGDVREMLDSRPAPPPEVLRDLSETYTVERNRPGKSIFSEGFPEKGALCDLVNEKFQAACQASPSIQASLEISGDALKPIEPGQ